MRSFFPLVYSYSNPLLTHLTYLQSAQIRLNRKLYEGFVVHPDSRDIMDVDSYCANIVQAMGKEAGELFVGYPNLQTFNFISLKIMWKLKRYRERCI